MTFYGDDGIIEKAAMWFMERVFLPFAIGGIAIATVCGVIAAAVYGFKYWNDAAKQIELPADQWECSTMVELWQPAYSCGGKIRRTCGGYSYTACRQWTHRNVP